MLGFYSKANMVQISKLSPSWFDQVNKKQFLRAQNDNSIFTTNALMKCLLKNTMPQGTVQDHQPIVTLT